MGAVALCPESTEQTELDPIEKQRFNPVTSPQPSSTPLLPAPISQEEGSFLPQHPHPTPRPLQHSPLTSTLTGARAKNPSAMDSNAAWALRP